MGETMKSIKNLFLSITLLASFTSVFAMENGDENNQETTWVNPAHGVKEYLVQHGMLDANIANNPSKIFGYSVDQGEGQLVFHVYDINSENDNPEQEINVSAVWNQLQHLWTPNQIPNNQE